MGSVSKSFVCNALLAKSVKERTWGRRQAAGGRWQVAEISKIGRGEARSGHEARYIQSSKSKRRECGGAERFVLQDQRVRGTKNKALDIA